MKSALTKLVAFSLALSFAVPSALLLYPARTANAQGKAGACIVGMITATGATVPQWVNDILGVPASQKSGTGDVLTRAGEHGNAFNECILKPLAKVMIIALIRNIGSSVVNWVNSGFEGKPLFVTDFAGTVLNAADQAAGNFIEGSELGFLCQDFSFQVRIALALKYSQPFRQRATCTLSEIGQNIQGFADGNGNVGWDNWLSVTTEPQNNVYGAYVIAENELTQRMARAAGIKEKRIAIGQGFLDFETCDPADYETPEEVNKRLAGSYTATPSGGSYASGQYTATVTRKDASSFGKFDTAGNLIEPSKTTVTTETFTSKSAKPQCKKPTISTPGTVIAGKLNNEFLKGDIQQAVASEIDDVIAATMNQLAQKMIQGAGGLLGLSKKRSSSSQSFYDKYQSYYYGTEQGATVADIGATSFTEDYAVSDYESAARLVEGSSQVQEIYGATNERANAAVQENQARMEALDQALGGSASEVDVALFKPAVQSSQGTGLPAKAVDGVKDGNASQYNQPASTGEEANPWWQVDLNEAKQIKEVRIWRVTNKPAANTLGRIRLVLSDSVAGNDWSSDYIAPSDSSPNPIIIPVGKTKRYVKIEKQGTLDEECRLDSGYRGEQIYESCYHPLELAEVEVISPVAVPQASKTGPSTPASSSQKDDGIPATSTVAWMVASPATSVTDSSPLRYELRLTAQKAVNGLRIESTLKKNAVALPFLSVFSSADFTYGAVGGQTATYSITSGNVGTVRLDRVSVSSGGAYMLRQTGSKNPSATPGTYVIETSVFDDAGNALETRISEFVVQ